MNHNQIAQHDYFPLINGLKFVVLNSTNGVKHSFLVIYRKQSRTIPGFITELEHILCNHDIDKVLGDFNINYMNSDDCNPLKSMMQSLNFKQGTCNTRYYTIKNQDRSRCFNDQKLVIFFQPQ